MITFTWKWQYTWMWKFLSEKPWKNTFDWCITFRFLTRIEEARDDLIFQILERKTFVEFSLSSFYLHMQMAPFLCKRFFILSPFSQLVGILCGLPPIFTNGDLRSTFLRFCCIRACVFKLVSWWINRSRKGTFNGLNWVTFTFIVFRLVRNTSFFFCLRYHHVYEDIVQCKNWI